VQGHARALAWRNDLDGISRLPNGLENQLDRHRPSQRGLVGGDHSHDLASVIEKHATRQIDADELGFETDLIGKDLRNTIGRQRHRPSNPVRISDRKSRIASPGMTQVRR
jgi:hypothetical protein